MRAVVRQRPKQNKRPKPGVRSVDEDFIDGWKVTRRFSFALYARHRGARRQHKPAVRRQPSQTGETKDPTRDSARDGCENKPIVSRVIVERIYRQYSRSQSDPTDARAPAHRSIETNESSPLPAVPAHPPLVDQTISPPSPTLDRKRTRESSSSLTRIQSPMHSHVRVHTRVMPRVLDV